MCAMDIERARLLGPIGCWKVGNLTSDRGTLAYQAPAPLPGGGFDVALDERCARGFCLPKDAKISPDKIAHLSWSFDGKKLAALVGEDVHLFDVSSKAHESSFSIHGEGRRIGPGRDPLVGDEVFVEGPARRSHVWSVFKTDGGRRTDRSARLKRPQDGRANHGSFLVPTRRTSRSPNRDSRR